RAVRAHCLKALASVNDAASTDRLAEMLSSTDAELRQGAFIALRMADPKHQAVSGTLMNGSYRLHRMAARGTPAVHLNPTGRPEVLIFGEVKLDGPMLPAPLGNEFTVSVPAANGPAKVTRVVKSIGGEPEIKEVNCPNDLGLLLKVVAELGGTYTEAVELIRRAARAQALSAAVELDAIPRELSVQQLAEFAKSDPTLAKADAEVAKIGATKTEIGANGFDPPTTQAPLVAPSGAALPRQPLNRDPGRLFGPKHVGETAPPLDPSVVPAGRP
ncbi:MAG: HEAT repeat domain-containing protein, partial [Gemmataceae bacterium]|nr:HEAT repeat domain-containing protein [Gemmataceae bacterium]